MSAALHELATLVTLSVATLWAVVHLRRIARPGCDRCDSATPASAGASRGVRSRRLRIVGQGGG